MAKKNKNSKYKVISFVIIIICLFAVIVIFVDGIDPHPPRKSYLTTNQLHFFEQSLQEFYLEQGRYPTQAEGLSILVKDPGYISKWRKYLNVDTIPKDDWGNRFIYEVKANNEVLISSNGEDKVRGTKDDLIITIKK